ncbi:MAG TPA: alpha/beta hydrolase-fold protein [Puia sp.]|nr:alpha/beta hydrolase-fold protein [Puia sp.]
MKKEFLLSLFFLLLIRSSMAQKEPDQLVLGTIDSLYSKVLGEERKIWVHVPNSDPMGIYSRQRYPVVYLLDGNAHFSSVVGMIQQLSEVNGNTICPQMIVVGIPNTDRTRDLTPTHALTSLLGPDSVFMKNSGGGERFTAFLEKELIPHIDSLYPTAPYRMLIGHSFGGLTAINILLNHTGLFNSYVAIDPSLWWDNQHLLKETSGILGDKRFDGKSLFLGIANTMKAGFDTLRVQSDTIAANGHIRAILKFSSLLREHSNSGLRWSYKYYDKDDHGTVPLITEYDALHFIFSEYRFRYDDMLNSDFKADSIINNHYARISKQMGYTVLPAEQMVNEMAYTYLNNGMSDKAYSLLAMNVKNYPKSFNVYDSMGDYYLTSGNKAKAIEWFGKALSLKEFPETRAKLEQLTNGK